MTTLAETFLLKEKTLATAYVRHPIDAQGQVVGRNQMIEVSTISGLEAAFREKKGNRS